MTVTRTGTSAHPKSRCDADLTMTTGELLGPKPPRATDTCNKVHMLRSVHLLYDSENEKCEPVKHGLTCRSAAPLTGRASNTTLDQPPRSPQ